jgi:hypothetical protein
MNLFLWFSHLFDMFGGIQPLAFASALIFFLWQRCSLRQKGTVVSISPFRTKFVALHDNRVPWTIPNQDLTKMMISNRSRLLRSSVGHHFYHTCPLNPLQLTSSPLLASGCNFLACCATVTTLSPLQFFPPQPSGSPSMKCTPFLNFSPA